jgi:hypothetical protein
MTKITSFKQELKLHILENYLAYRDPEANDISSDARRKDISVTSTSTSTISVGNNTVFTFVVRNNGETSANV